MRLILRYNDISHLLRKWLFSSLILSIKNLDHQNDKMKQLSRMSMQTVIQDPKYVRKDHWIANSSWKLIVDVQVRTNSLYIMCIIFFMMDVYFSLEYLCQKIMILIKNAVLKHLIMKTGFKAVMQKNMQQKHWPSTIWTILCRKSQVSNRIL